MLQSILNDPLPVTVVTAYFGDDVLIRFTVSTEFIETFSDWSFQLIDGTVQECWTSLTIPCTEIAIKSVD